MFLIKYKTRSIYLRISVYIYGCQEASIYTKLIPGDCRNTQYLQRWHCSGIPTFHPKPPPSNYHLGRFLRHWLSLDLQLTRISCYAPCLTFGNMQLRWWNKHLDSGGTTGSKPRNVIKASPTRTHWQESTSSKPAQLLAAESLHSAPQGERASHQLLLLNPASRHWRTDWFGAQQVRWPRFADFNAFDKTVGLMLAWYG